MQFRRTFVIPKLKFASQTRAEDLTYTLRRGRLRIELRTLPADDPAALGVEDTTAATVTLDQTPRDLIAQQFEAIRHNRRSTSLDELLGAWSAAKQGLPWDQQEVVFLESMPGPFQDYVASIRSSMADAVTRLIGLLRWRNAQNGPANAIASSGALEWSTDGVNWHLMPFVPQSSVSAMVTLAFNEERRDQVQSLLDVVDLSEPAYRELHREAVELIESSPRSALVLAVAAAEIAIKTICTEIGAAALLEDQNAPPAVHLYRDELVRLLVRNTVRGTVAAPPERLLESLERAISARNNLVHRGAPPLDRDSLIMKMNDIRDLLLIVDYYRGYEWAFDQLVDATKAEMIAAAGIPNDRG